jgi:acyl-CoA reductase-like NAD-dependent aldehyde dehydrogenase
VTDERIKLLSFTGSAESGWELKARAGKKKVSLELGGNAACIVEADADLDDAVQRLVFGAFYQSGQSCISVQRILIQSPIYPQLRDRLVTATRMLRCGNPRDEHVSIGPVITDKDAERLEAWIAEAVRRGGRVLCGGKRNGRMVEPTLLEHVPPDASLCAQEAFGPVAVLEPYDHFDGALARANASRYGLQAGLFTRDLTKMFRAWDELEVGGVVINDVPSWRADQMPYGGVKESGLGREGIRFSMEEMSEIRMLVVRTK